jgi:hypothetical protein
MCAYVFILFLSIQCASSVSFQQLTTYNGEEKPTSNLLHENFYNERALSLKRARFGLNREIIQTMDCNRCSRDYYTH